MNIIANVIEQEVDKITKVPASPEQITYHDSGDLEGFSASLNVDVVDEKGKVLLPANTPRRFHHTRRLCENSWLLISA